MLFLYPEGRQMNLSCPKFAEDFPAATDGLHIVGDIKLKETIQQF